MKKPAPLPRRPPYTIKSAALYLSVSTKTIRRLIDRRVLRVSRILNRKHLIPAEDVENLVGGPPTF